jgi:hypothetical protein
MTDICNTIAPKPCKVYHWYNTAIIYFKEEIEAKDNEYTERAEEKLDLDKTGAA